MLVAAAEQSSGSGLNFNGFDIFMFVFTLILAIAVFRLLRAKEKNIFAILFSLAALGTFVFLDITMIRLWFA